MIVERSGRPFIPETETYEDLNHSQNKRGRRSRIRPSTKDMQIDSSSLSGSLGMQGKTSRMSAFSGNEWATVTDCIVLLSTLLFLRIMRKITSTKTLHSATSPSSVRITSPSSEETTAKLYQENLKISRQIRQLEQLNTRLAIDNMNMQVSFVLM